MRNSVYSALRRALCVTPLLLCTLPLAGCGGGTATPTNYQSDGTSGVRGTAYLRNNDGTKTPFANGTVAATVDVCPSVGEAACYARNVVQAQTDAQGNFTLPLIPGTYGFGFVLSSGATGAAIDPSGMSIIVKARQFTSVSPIGAVFVPL